MQGLRLFHDEMSLELNSSSNSLTIDVEETTKDRIQRLVSENPVVIFSRSSCCMCHVMKSLLLSVGAHPTVIEVDEEEISALSSTAGGAVILDGAPAVVVGGDWVGGLECLVALHLSGHLIPKLAQAGVVF